MLGIPVYLINLDTDVERLEFVDAQLRDLKMDYERFPAVRGSDLPEWLVPYFYGKNGDLASHLYPGEIGCYASHLDLMRKVAGSDQPALILEDDIRLAPETPAIIRDILSRNFDWDIIRLSSADRMPTVCAGKLGYGYDLVQYSRVPLRTGAYLIAPSGARKFLNWTIPRTRPIDHDIRRIWEMNLITYGVSPIPIQQNVLASTIDAAGGRVTKGKKHVKHTARDKWNRFVYNLKTLGAMPTLGTMIRL